MALSKMFKKNTAPEELPDLAIDELKKDLNKDFSEKEEKTEIPKPQETPPVVEEKAPEVQEEIPSEKETEEAKNEKDETEETPPEIDEKEIEEVDEKPEEKPTKEEVNLEKSFFNPLISELKKDNFDPYKINSWYEKKFSGKSAIEEMKEYWENQKDEFITETVEKEFKARINEKMIDLQKLEAEWQEIYINLVKKEEEMKKEEKNIKKIMKDFSLVIKKKGNLKKAHKTK